MPGDMSVIIALKGGDVKLFNAARRRAGGTSRMARECQVRFCEGLGVEFPGLLGNRAIPAMRHPLPVYPDKQTFSEPVGASHLCQQATFHFGHLAPQRRGVNFLLSLVSRVPPQH